MIHALGGDKRRLIMSKERYESKSTTVEDKVIDERQDNTISKEKESTATESTKIFGVVENCGQLRIRESASKNSTVITTIPAGAEVQLQDEKVINGFYAVHVSLADGGEIDGYCMTDYIHISQ